ncbi:GIY-YIG nuclease family protein [Aliagarivorans taiwanensis]|uniref:GIY-YIG nuclease family protein n=1 Tax=Aliagarivorans taiwanensis TaxID=561966 RepID=UPI000412E8CB|nr:GIY-YIG nuclease family protein [Aliagarivorans taiwanensis]
MKELHQLTPLQNQIVDKSIDNVNRKLIAGYRNRSLNKPTTGNTVKAATASDAMDVANRGQMWKEMIAKSFSHGIGSISTLQFDRSFTVQGGQAQGLEQQPDKPGVYVVYDSSGNIRYIGDSSNVNERWQKGHLGEGNSDKPYKLDKELAEGCTVKVIDCDSVETAAALEAALIDEVGTENLINSRTELSGEQTSRSNIEAKKIKERMGSAASLAGGAAIEGAKNGGWVMLEQLVADCLKALKDEIVDLFYSGEPDLLERVKRLLSRWFESIKQQLTNVRDFAKGVFEFVVNALSKAISQVYQLARNLFDLGHAAWSLYKNKETMSKEELVSKVTETVVISANVSFWSSMDMMLEGQLFPLVGPAAPILSALISALGFGLCSNYLSQFVPKIVEYIYGGFAETKEQLRESALQLVESSQMNMRLLVELEAYAASSVGLMQDVTEHERRLSELTPRNATIRSEVDL